MPKNSVDKTIELIAGGDRDALADLYQQVRTQVYSYALSVLKNRADAEDVLSETVMEIWRSAPAYRPQGKPTAWIIAIAKNLCYMKLRERGRASDEPTDYDSIFDPSALTPEDRAVIRAVIESLDENEREVVILHAAVGLKHREIAKLLNAPLSTVLSRYQRAIGKLRKTLNDEKR